MTVLRINHLISTKKILTFMLRPKPHLNGFHFFFFFLQKYIFCTCSNSPKHIKDSFFQKLTTESTVQLSFLQYFEFFPYPILLFLKLLQKMEYDQGLMLSEKRVNKNPISLDFALKM